jgi:hypothetical protein
MLLPLLILLFQSPEIVMHNERIDFRGSDLHLGFIGFSRTDLVEIIPAGKQEQPGIGISSAAIRNLVVQHRTKSYTTMVEQLDNVRQRRAAISFQPADVRQDAVLIITVPEGVRLSFSTRSEIIQGHEFREPIFLHDGRIERGLKSAALETLHARVARREIVVPVMPPFLSAPKLIHSERPDLDTDELRATRRLLAKGTAAVFEATVTETGQVIDLLQTSSLPGRLPASVIRKLRDAAMRYSYEPHLANGRAQPFRTSIVLEVPQ